MNRTLVIALLLGGVLLIPFLLVEGAKGSNLVADVNRSAGGLGDPVTVHVSRSGGVVSVNTRPIQRTPTLSRSTAVVSTYQNPTDYAPQQRSNVPQGYVETRPGYVVPQPGYVPPLPEYNTQQGSTYYPQ